MNSVKNLVPLLLLSALFCGCADDHTPDAGADSVPGILYEWMSNPLGARLPDYSYAGYRGGELLPHVSDTAPRFLVTDFGAVPNDGKDDIAAIQRAVDAAQAAGGGVVLFPQGTFDFDVATKERFVWVKSSGIVIRGWSDGPDGTILHDHTASDYPDKTKKWLAGKHPSFFYFGSVHPDSSYSFMDDASNLVTEVNPAGKFENSVTVKDTGSVKVGSVYWLSMESEDSSLVLDLIKPLTSFGKNFNENEGNKKYKYGQWVTVIKKHGETIYLDNPLMWDLQSRWKPKLWKNPAMIEESGVEYMRMLTDWHEEFIHHKDPVHDNGWDHIKFNAVTNGWVRGITHVNTSTAAGFSGCKNGIVYDCRIIGNRGHNGWVLSGCSRMLLYNLQGGSQLHAYSISGQSVGNVYHRCYTDEGGGLDLHGSLSVYNLFDEMEGGMLRSGGSPGATPPHHARGLTLWNINMSLVNPYSYRIVNDVAKFASYPQIIAVGIRGQKNQELFFKTAEDEEIKKDTSFEWASIEALNSAVVPTSLYRFQHQKRTGYDFPQPVKP